MSKHSLYVAYLRDSGGPDQDNSTDQQLESISAYAEEHGLVVTRYFRDRARSGSSTTSREQFLSMVRYLENPATAEAGVILWSYARFARDYDDTQFYLASLRRAGRQVISVSDDIPAGLDGRLMESLIAWQNAKYLEDLSRNVRRARRSYITNHHVWMGGPPPLGYRLVRDTIDDGQREVTRLEIDPETAPLVVRAFEARARGANFADVAAILGLCESQAAHLLRSKIYLGIFETHHAQDDYTAHGYCSAIIDQSLWHQVQRVNRSRRHPRSVSADYILSGLLDCQHCGESMWGSGTTGSRYYRCYETSCQESRLIQRGEIETTVLAALRRYLLSSQRVQAMHRQATLPQPRDHREEIRDKLSTNQKQIQRILDAITQTGHSDALLSRLATLEEQGETLAEQLTAERQRLASVPSAEEIETRRLDLLDMLEDAPSALQRVIVQQTIERVTASRDDNDDLHVEIVFRAICV